MSAGYSLFASGVLLLQYLLYVAASLWQPADEPPPVMPMVLSLCQSQQQWLLVPLPAKSTKQRRAWLC